MDFGALPPEIILGRMYCGPVGADAGCGRGLGRAVELGWRHRLVRRGAELTGAPGGCGVVAVAAATPYVAWLSRQRGAPSRRGMQAGGRGGLRGRFVMTVPPPDYGESGLVMTLIATNFFSVRTRRRSRSLRRSTSKCGRKTPLLCMAMYCTGERVAVDSVHGAAEDHQLRWVVAQAVASVSWPNPNDWWLVRLGPDYPHGATTIVRLLGQSCTWRRAWRDALIAQQLTGPGGPTAGSAGTHVIPAGLGAGPAVASLARAEPVGRLSVPLLGRRVWPSRSLRRARRCPSAKRPAAVREACFEAYRVGESGRRGRLRSPIRVPPQRDYPVSVGGIADPSARPPGNAADSDRPRHR